MYDSSVFYILPKIYFDLSTHESVSTGNRLLGINNKGRKPNT